MRALAFLAIASCLFAGEWRRHVLTAKGQRFDYPEPHPLSYFTRNPALRDEQDQGTGPPKGGTELRRIGEIAGLSIYDLLYFFDTPKPAWKSILVPTGQDQFREICQGISGSTAGLTSPSHSNPADWYPKGVYRRNVDFKWTGCRESDIPKHDATHPKKLP